MRNPTTPAPLRRVIALLLLLAVAAPAQDPPDPLPPLPTPRHLPWHGLEYYAFVHFNMNTFTDVEWGEGRESPATFAPTELDCRQWCRIFRDAGMRGVIITAKHHDGFCLWPSRETEHSVAASPWRDGKGDVLRELSDACREFGLRFGVYLSPWDRNHPAYGDSPRYNAVFKSQLAEVLTRYGDVFEVWFDGACGEGPNGKRQEYDWPGFVQVVREHAPQAVIFSDAGPDVRWMGNERGVGSETNWAPFRRDEFYPGIPDRNRELGEGHEDGTHWVPAEVDVSIRPGWYYHPDQDDDVKSVEQLVDIWFTSVGRGCNLLLNVPVDRRGVVHENDAARLLAFKRARDVLFGDDLARRAERHATTPGTLDLAFESPVWTDAVGIAERIELGQRVRRFRLEAASEDGAFRTLVSGTTIGPRRLLRFPPVRSSRFRLVIEDARAAPAIATLSLFCGPPRVSIEPAGGTFSGRQTVTITADRPDVVVRYTLDESEPTERSPSYRGPIVLDRTAVVRAAAWNDSGRSVTVASAHFLRE